jgi:hypothetical protein
VRNTFSRAGGTRRFARILFCRLRPDFFRWVGLFPLDVRHLAERMFFAGYAKEKRAERNGNDALAKEANHNALPQLSASGVGCKDESAGMQSSVNTGSLGPPQCGALRQGAVILNGVKDLAQVG